MCLHAREGENTVQGNSEAGSREQGVVCAGASRERSPAVLQDRVSPAVHGDRVVARLLLLLLHRRNEVDHAFALGGDPDLGPAVEVELANHAGLLLLAGQGLREEKAV